MNIYQNIVKKKINKNFEICAKEILGFISINQDNFSKLSSGKILEKIKNEENPENILFLRNVLKEK